MSLLALETSALRKTFGELVAVDGLDLAVPRGSFYGFLGPNGAGKSTTIKCLTGLLRPTSGSCRILGLDPLVDPVGVKKKIGVVPEDLALFDRLTGAETLTFVGQVYGLDAASLRQRSGELLEIMDLVQASSELVADYSHGMRKKIALAAALLPAPRLLFLDEPFEGIDAVASRQVKGLLIEFARNGGTVFLTSHILEIVERLCDYIGVIQKGRLIAQGPLADLRAGAGTGKTLEELFLALIGAEYGEAPKLDWLAGR
jgi:ABC-2 type transport system ATP-binding protein